MATDVRPLTGKAADALALPTAWITAYEGSVRSGKTWASLLDWLRYIRSSPTGPLLMTGRTERTIYQNLLIPLQEMLGPRRVRIVRGTGTATVLGRQVLVIGANNEAARTKIQGLSLVGAYVDEASTLPESYFNMLGTRLSEGVARGGGRMWLTSNPEGPAHWLKTQWLDKAQTWVQADGSTLVRDPATYDLDDPDRPIDLTRVSFRLDDNANLDPGYVERVKSSYSGLWYRRFIGGEWCVAEGAVYPEWDENIHVVRDLPPIRRVVGMGVDWGSTNATRGILVGVSDEPSPRLVAMAEWAPPQMSNVKYVAHLQQWLAGQPEEWRRPEWFYVDSSARDLRRTMHDAGLTNTAGATHRVVDGISTVASLLSTRRLVIAESCTELRKEVPSYTWDPKATERGEDAPNKKAGADHSCDALRYAVHPTKILWARDVGLALVDGGA